MKHKKNNSNFKKVLAAAAVSTAVVVVPAVVADASTPLIDAVGADKKINYTLKLNLGAIPELEFAEKFEWFYVDDINGTNPIPIPNATTSTFKVPIEALGKIIQLKVTTTDKHGTVKVLDGTHVVSDIKLVFGEIELIGDGTAFVMGDTITVGAINLKHEDATTLNKSDLLFENGQVNYSYQWYEQLEGSGYSIIPGATGRSYIIPADIDAKNLVAKVTVELNGESYSSLTKPYKLEDGSGIVDALIEKIDLLIDPRAVGQEIYSSSTELESFIINVDDLLSSYNNFATNAKAEVTNIDILLEAKKDIYIADQYVLSLQQHATKLATIKIEGDLTEKQATELEQLLNVLQAERELLNSLQISLVDKILEENNDLPVYDTLIESVEEKLSNRQYDIVFDTIKEINEDIASKFDPSLDLNATPIEIDELKMKYTTSLEALTTGVKTLNNQINKLPKKYRPFVFTSLIKQMEGDIKKASAVVGKLEKIKNVSFDKKQTTAMSAFKSYVKLTPLQRSLVDPSLVSEMQTILTVGPEVDLKVTSLVDEIEETLFSSTLDYEAYSVDDLTTLESEIKVLTESYKKLSSAEKKLIPNYKYLAAASKDLKAALRVQDIFEEAEKLETAIGGETLKEELAATKKAISKYKSAITAHTKLTKLQQTFISNLSLNQSLGTYGTLVQNSKQLEIDIKLEKKPDLEIEVPDFSFNSKIQELFSSDELTYTGKLPDFQTVVEDLLAQYKAMKSTEKKGVYSNSQLTKANSDVKKAKGVYEKLLAASATGANDEKKYASALASYKKLTSLQQSLIDISSIEAPVEEENESVSNVITGIEDIKNGLVTDFEEIKELEKEYNALSSSDKKLVTNASDLKSTLKDVKAVEAFAAKVIKLGSNPKMSQKESIVKNYYKLTMAQANLFNADFEEAKTLLLGFEASIHNKTQEAQILNNKINEVLDETDIETIKSKITEIESDYAALASADRKLVTNYSKLSTVKRDIDAVEKVIDLYKLIPAEDSPEYKKAEKDWQRAYNKLNTRQLSLYP